MTVDVENGTCFGLSSPHVAISQTASCADSSPTDIYDRDVQRSYFATISYSSLIILNVRILSSKLVKAIKVDSLCTHCLASLGRF